MYMDEEKREIAVCIPAKDSHLMKKMDGLFIISICL